MIALRACYGFNVLLEALQPLIISAPLGDGVYKLQDVQKDVDDIEIYIERCHDVFFRSNSELSISHDQLEVENQTASITEGHPVIVIQHTWAAR